ncbi:MAG: hypothetical protein U0637_09340 [Phycisphaerales bacterium]
MIFFVLAFGVVQACTWVLGTFDARQHHALIGTGLSSRDFFQPMVLMPMLAAWFGAEGAGWWRRPKLLEPCGAAARPATWVWRLVAGTLAGLLHILLGGLGLTLVAERLPDWIVLSCAGFAAAVVVVAFLPTHRRSGCPRCGYDWRGLARCPECGTLRHAGDGTLAAAGGL